MKHLTKLIRTIFLVFICNSFMGQAFAQTSTTMSPQDPHAISDFLASKNKRFGLSLDIHAADQPYVSNKGYPRLPRPNDYLERISPYFNYYTIPVNFSNLHFRSKDQFDFSKDDQLVAFAVRHHANIKGHSLLFPATTPDWITKANPPYTADQLRDILKTHIQTVVIHFKNLKELYRKQNPDFNIDYQVTNEITCNTAGLSKDPAKCSQPEEILADGTTINPELVGLKKTIWSGIHKPGSSDPSDYIQLAFEWAHEADPEAKLYMAENVMPGPHLNTVYGLADYLVKKKIPLNGIGIEGHISLGWANTPYKVAGREYNLNTLQNLVSGVKIGGETFAGLESFANLGLETQFTEFDVALTDSIGLRNFQPIDPYQSKAYQAALTKQSELYKLFFTACMNAKNCTLFNIFGAWDPLDYTVLHPEIPYGGQYRPFIIDDNWNLKPAFWSIYNSVPHK